jgi:16S rRNA (cytidine1402-2'-O)-methyltransferase
MSVKTGILYLIPSALGETTGVNCLPVSTLEVIRSLTHFIVEDERTARRFLKTCELLKSIQELKLELLNEHTDNKTLDSLIAPLLTGTDLGLLSDAGCPGVADPGAGLVAMAHNKGIKVVPLIGPSSILLALMGSGFNGQSFCFHGYLPKDQSSRKKKLMELERTAIRTGQTQIFIETPYRNQNLIEDAFSCLEGNTRFCIACDLSLATAFHQTKTIAAWKKTKPDINKRPAVFLIGV